MPFLCIVKHNVIHYIFHCVAINLFPIPTVHQCFILSPGILYCCPAYKYINTQCPPIEARTLTPGNSLVKLDMTPVRRCNLTTPCAWNDCLTLTRRRSSFYHRHHHQQVRATDPSPWQRQSFRRSDQHLGFYRVVNIEYWSRRVSVSWPLTLHCVPDSIEVS